MKKQICENCGEVLCRATIGYQEKVYSYMSISLFEGRLEYDEFDTALVGDYPIFFCRNCGKELFLLTEKEVIKILKEEE